MITVFAAAATLTTMILIPFAVVEPSIVTPAVAQGGNVTEGNATGKGEGTAQ